MTAQDLTDDRRGATPSTAASASTPARTRIVAAALAAGSATVIAVLAWKPWPARDDLSYTDLAPVRDTAWAGAVLDGVGFAVAAVALALAVCLLAPARGAIWANVAAVVTALGGIVFCGGIVSLGVVAWYATADGAVPATAGTSLLEHVADEGAHLIAVQAAGFLLHSVGLLLVAVALWRARSVPRWVPIAVAVLTVATFSGVPGRALDVVEAARTATALAVAWYLWRTATRRA